MIPASLQRTPHRPSSVSNVAIEIVIVPIIIQNPVRTCRVAVDWRMIRVQSEGRRGRMLAGKIYLRVGDRLVAMHETAYDAEDILQGLIADYPDLLAGDQMRPGAPRRWLLIQREAGIEDQVGGLARFSLDHLFIDQEAVPTLIEVKRQSDTRIRREVVGQMLDYAANVVAHWPPGELRNRFVARAMNDGLDPDGLVAEHLGAVDATGVDAFWAAADANLAARRLRLVFVADVIPRELLRIIEFLNESFVRTEVFGVEVRQFVGAEGQQTLVPRVVGLTAASEQVKQAVSGGARANRQWTVEDLRAEAVTVGGPPAARLVDAVIAWSARRGMTPGLGAGKSGPIYLETPATNGRRVRIANVNTSGQTQWQYDLLAAAPPFDDEAMRLECNRRLNAIPGVALDDRYAVKRSWPTIRADVLASDVALASFYEVVDWVAQQIGDSASQS